MKKKRIFCLLLSLLFLAAGGLSLYLSRTVLRSGGATEILAIHLPSGARAEEFRPECVLSQGAGAALLLAHGGDGSRLIASELARRGVTVLLAGADHAAEAWEYLVEAPYVHRSAMGLLARGRDAEKALALAEELIDSGKCPGATVLCGRAAFADEASDAVRNLSVFVRSSDTADGETEGYFADGTARCVRSVGTSWYKRGVKTALFDWLGSSLGHNIEIADEDIRCGESTAWLIAAVGSWLAAAVCLVICVKKEGT